MRENGYHKRMVAQLEELNRLHLQSKKDQGTKMTLHEKATLKQLKKSQLSIRSMFSTVEPKKKSQQRNTMEVNNGEPPIIDLASSTEACTSKPSKSKMKL